MRTSLILAVVTCAFASVSAGQTPRSGAYLGGGFEAAGMGAPYERAYGLALQAGYALQYGRLGLRLGATYFKRNRELSSGFVAHPRAAGATVELGYDLTASRLRPYLLAGGGAYRVTSTGTGRSVEAVTPAIIGGLGFRYRVGSVNVFTEARVHGLTNGQNWASVFAPVTFGVRF